MVKIVAIALVLGCMTFTSAEEGSKQRIARQAGLEPFSCKGKKSNEYYADVQSGCQSYFVCVGASGGSMRPVKFNCNPNTIFNQASKVCTPKAQWDCSLTFRFYDSRKRKHMKGSRDFVTTTTTTAAPDSEEEQRSTRPPRRRRPVPSNQNSLSDFRNRRPTQTTTNSFRNRRPVQSNRNSQRNRRPVQSNQDSQRNRRPVESEEENSRQRRPAQTNRNNNVSQRRRPTQSNQNSVLDVTERRPQVELKPFNDFESVSEFDGFDIPVSVNRRPTPQQSLPTEPARPPSVPQGPSTAKPRPISLPRRPSVPNLRPIIPGTTFVPKPQRPASRPERPIVRSQRPVPRPQPTLPPQEIAVRPAEPFDLFDLEPISPQRINTPGNRVPVVRRRPPVESDEEVKIRTTFRPPRRTVRRRRPSPRRRRPRPSTTEATTTTRRTTTTTTTRRPKTEPPTEVPDEVTTRSRLGGFPAIPVGDSFPFRPPPSRSEISDNDDSEDDQDFDGPRTPFSQRPPRPNILNNIPERGPPVSVVPPPRNFLNRDRPRRPSGFSNQNRRPEAESLDIIPNNDNRRPNSFSNDNAVRPINEGIRTSFRRPSTLNTNPFFRPPPSLGGGGGGIVFPPPRSDRFPKNVPQEEVDEEVTSPVRSQNRSPTTPLRPQRPRRVNLNPSLQRPRPGNIQRPGNQRRKIPDIRTQGPNNGGGFQNRRRVRGRRRRPQITIAAESEEIPRSIERDPFRFDRDFGRTKREVSEDLGFPLTTSFICTDKIAGGLYADSETGCRMYHICVPMTKGKLVDYKYICPNNTVFNQQDRKCDLPKNVHCNLSHHFYQTKKVMHGDAKPKKYYAKMKAVTKDYKSRSDPRFKREIRYDRPSVQCKESKIGAHFADLNSGCANFYICVPDDFHSGAVRVTLSCLDGYLFDQKTQNCEKASKVACKKSAPSANSNIMGVFIEKN